MEDTYKVFRGSLGVSMLVYRVYLQSLPKIVANGGFLLDAGRGDVLR